MRARTRPPPAAAAFDALAAEWDAGHGPGSPRAPGFADRIAWLRAACHRRGVARVLEAGCGTGHNLLALADLLDHGTGVDAAPAMIRYARRNAGAHRHLRFVTADARTLSPAALGPFDAVILAGALEHMPPAAETLRTAAALTAPEGCVLVIMPHPWRPRRRGEPPPPPPLRLLSPRALAAVAPRAGLRLAALAGLGPAAPRRRRADALAWRPLPLGLAGSLGAARHAAYAAELTRAGP